MTRVLVTGGSGFAGSHLLELLSADTELELHATSISSVPESLQALLPSVKFHTLDLTDQVAVDKLINLLQPQQLYHLAALPSVAASFSQAAQTLQNNLLVSLWLLEAVATKAPECRVLTVSSAEIYGVSQEGELPINEAHPFRPVSPYAVSKVAQDLLAYSYFVSRGVPILLARPFNHIGERQAPAFVAADFAKQIVSVERGQQENIEVGNLAAVRDFLDVKDVVRAYQLIMNKGTTGEAYNIASGQGVEIAELLNMLIALAQKPMAIQQNQRRLRPSDVPVMIGDSSKLHRLGWQPKIPLSATLQRIIDYWRKQP